MGPLSVLAVAATATAVLALSPSGRELGGGTGGSGWAGHRARLCEPAARLRAQPRAGRRRRRLPRPRARLLAEPGADPARLAISRDESRARARGATGRRRPRGEGRAARPPARRGQLPGRRAQRLADRHPHLRAGRLPLGLAGDRRRLVRKPRPARVRLPPRPGRRPGPDRAPLRGPGRAPGSPPTATWCSSPPRAPCASAPRSPTSASTASGSRSSRPTCCTASAPSALSLGAYDASRPLVIDPLLMTYSTFIGGVEQRLARGIAVDGSGAAYLPAAIDAATDYPTTPGAFDRRTTATPTPS